MRIAVSEFFWAEISCSTSFSLHLQRACITIHYIQGFVHKDAYSSVQRIHTAQRRDIMLPNTTLYRVHIKNEAILVFQEYRVVFAYIQSS